MLAYRILVSAPVPLGLLINCCYPFLFLISVASFREYHNNNPDTSQMPRIDPAQLLKTLGVLLAPHGGIKSTEEVRNGSFVHLIIYFNNITLLQLMRIIKGLSY